MKKIYKKKGDGNLPNLDDRLNAYAKEKISKPMNSLKTFTKGSLAVLAPLAAASLVTSDLNAQCGLGTFDPTGGYYGGGALDVDGDGVIDFEFDLYNNNIVMTPVGTMSMSVIGAANSFTNYVNLIPLNSTIVSSGNFVSDFYTFEPGASGTVYVPIITAAGNLGFVEFTLDGNGGFIIDLSQTGVADNTDSQIGSGDCSTLGDVPLPISLINFDAEARDKAIALSWKTGSELDNRGFEIERSADGLNFYKIGWESGAGTSIVEQDYKFIDKNARANVVYYYRLKQIDLTGEFDYSKIVEAKLEGNGTISIGNVYPNPVSTSQASLEITSQEAKEISYEIIDVLGKVIFSNKQVLNAGLNTIAIETSTLVNGNYFMKITDQNYTEFKKLVIQK